MSSEKFVLYIAITIGGFVGGWLPTLFGQDALSGWSILWSTVGGIAGIWIWVKLSR